MSDTIRDWLRKHPEITLTAEQADDLEMMIEEDCREDEEDLFSIVKEAWMKGWRAGRQPFLEVAEKSEPEPPEDLI